MTDIPVPDPTLPFELRTDIHGNSFRVRALPACPVCGANNMAPVIDTEDFETGSGPYSLMDCAQCGALFTSPQVVDEDVPALYATRTTADFNPGRAGPLRRLLDGLRRINARRQVKKAVGALGLKEPFTAVDVGCGDGLFTMAIADHPLCRAVNATDFQDTAPDRLANAGVPYYSHEAFSAREAVYDLMFCRHVLEHVNDPAAFVRAMGAYLKPGGYLYVEVPNYNSVWLRLFGRFYSILYLPRHMYFFTEDTVGDMFGGMEVVNVSRAHSPAIWRSVGYRFGKTWSNVGLIGVALYPIQVLADMVRGGSTTLVALARKPKMVDPA